MTLTPPDLELRAPVRLADHHRRPRATRLAEAHVSFGKTGSWTAMRCRLVPLAMIAYPRDSVSSYRLETVRSVLRSGVSMDMLDLSRNPGEDAYHFVIGDPVVVEALLAEGYTHALAMVHQRETSEPPSTDPERIAAHWLQSDLIDVVTALRADLDLSWLDPDEVSSTEACTRLTLLVDGRDEWTDKLGIRVAHPSSLNRSILDLSLDFLGTVVRLPWVSTHSMGPALQRALAELPLPARSFNASSPIRPGLIDRFLERRRTASPTPVAA